MDMGKRIELAKVNAERRYAEKQARREKAIPEDPAAMTPEELDDLLNRLENYEGKTLDMDKATNHKELSELAHWLMDHCLQVEAIGIEKIHSSHPNVVVWIELRRLASLKGDDLKVFSRMTGLADDLFFSGINGESIRISFAVMNVWKEKF